MTTSKVKRAASTSKGKVKGAERDCICEKPHGEHRKHCDAYRLSQFLTRAAGVIVSSAKIKKTKSKEGNNIK